MSSRQFSQRNQRNSHSPHQMFVRVDKHLLHIVRPNLQNCNPWNLPVDGELNFQHCNDHLSLIWPLQLIINPDCPLTVRCTMAGLESQSQTLKWVLRCSAISPNHCRTSNFKPAAASSKLQSDIITASKWLTIFTSIGRHVGFVTCSATLSASSNTWQLAAQARSRCSWMVV